VVSFEELVYSSEQVVFVDQKKNLRVVAPR
jgi:hypothetical protein